MECGFRVQRRIYPKGSRLAPEFMTTRLTSKQPATPPVRTPWAFLGLCSFEAVRDTIDSALALDADRRLHQPSAQNVACLHPFGFARESLILLYMQTLDGHIDMRLDGAVTSRWKSSCKQGQANSDVYPASQRIRSKNRELIGGTAMSMTTEILFECRVQPTTRRLHHV